MKISKTVRDMTPSGIRAFFDLVLGMKDVISLGVGEPDFVTPWDIREAIIYSIEKGFTSYTSNKGLKELRELLSDYILGRTGHRYDPETEILITVGVSEAMDLVMRALLEGGERVLIPEPCYVSYGPTVDLAGGEPFFLRTSKEAHFKLDPAEIEKSGKRAVGLVLNFPCNPTGASYRREELEAIAGVVEKRGLFVVSDEIYDDLTYDFPHVPFPSLPGMRERTVYLNGFSKGHAMTGWRIGYAAGPAEVIAAMTKIHQYTMLCAPISGQMGACEAIRRCAGAVEAMKKEYNRRRRFIVKRLNEIGLSCHLPEGAFYAFPSIEGTGYGSMEFAQKLLEEEKVAVVPGTAFGPSGEGFLRLAYAASMEDIREAMNRMQRFLKGL